MSKKTFISSINNIIFRKDASKTIHRLNRKKLICVRFHMVIIIFKGRCCFESDLEAVRICHEWNTPFLLVRTQFDVDLAAFVRDQPKVIQTLAAEGKCNVKEIARYLREDIADELSKSLLKQSNFSDWFLTKTPSIFFQTRRSK